jgi:hypothetical protein
LKYITRFFKKKQKSGNDSGKSGKLLLLFALYHLKKTGEFSFPKIFCLALSHFKWVTFPSLDLFHSQAAPEQLFRICRSSPEGFPQCCYPIYRRITPTLTLPRQGGGKNKKHPLSRGREYYLPTHSEKEPSLMLFLYDQRSTP